LKRFLAFFSRGDLRLEHIKFVSGGLLLDLLYISNGVPLDEAFRNAVVLLLFVCLTLGIANNDFELPIICAAGELPKMVQSCRSSLGFAPAAHHDQFVRGVLGFKGIALCLILACLNVSRMKLCSRSLWTKGCDGWVNGCD
jgi:hypothetical protein